jgi:predicted DNA-binding ribbon-helix-helix protein
MYDMTIKAVTRTVRLEKELDERIEQLAAARDLSVSAFIREILADASEREGRRKRLERALKIAARLPDPSTDRDDVWGIGTRVPR